MNTEKVSMWRLIAFAAPAFLNFFMYGPLSSILPTIYAKYFGLDLAVIGTVLLVSRIFDAVNDPLIGYLSDHTKTRIGRRKPWMLAGYGLLLFALYALFVPPEKVSATYFMVCSILFYLFMTMAEIPYMAWQAELSLDYRQRARIVTYRTVSLNLGGALFAALPFLPIFTTTAFTPAVLRIAAWSVIFLLPPLILLAVFVVPEGKEVSVRESVSFSEQFSSFTRNKPFLHLLACFIPYCLSQAVSGTTMFVYIDTYLLLGDKYPLIMLAGMIASVAAMPVWLKIMNRFGRHRSWAVGAFITGLLFPLFLLFEPRTQFLMALLLLNIVLNAIFIVGSLAYMAMLGDIIDYDTLKTGASRSGQYYAVLTLLMKGVYAFGSGFVFFVLKFFHYDPAVNTHDVTSVLGLRLILVWIPIVLLFLSAIAIWFSPIDERRQRIIKRRIESRSERAKRNGA